MEAAVNQVEEYLFSRQEEFNIRSIYSFYDLERAQSTLLLTDEENATLSTKEVIERIEKDMPTLAIGKPSFEFDQQGGGEGFSLQISGDSTTVLNELGVDIARVLSSLDGLKDVRSDAESGDKEVRVVIDRDRAGAAGLTTREIAETIAIAMRGQNLREFRGEYGEVAVRLAFREDEKQSVEQLANLPIYKPNGERITLGSVASLHIGQSPDTIRRTDRQTSVVLEGNLEDESTLEDVRPKVEELMAQIELPPMATARTRSAPIHSLCWRNITTFPFISRLRHRPSIFPSLLATRFRSRYASPMRSPTGSDVKLLRPESTSITLPLM